MEEERRLCYVGITRAQHRLILTRAKRRSFYGQIRMLQASRFLREIPEDCWDERCRPRDERYRYAGVDSLEFASPSRLPGMRTGVGRGAEPAPRAPRLEIPGRAAPGAFKPGDRVRHAQFGDGIVTRSTGSGDDEEVRVVFPGHGEKKLIVGYARLVKL
jgi:DNA helicase-2/ATP-dependent DNA helicase PcrA